MTPKNKTLMWLGILFASILSFLFGIILSFPLLAYSYLIIIIASAMTINSTIKYFQERKRGRIYNYAERKGWDRNNYGKSGARKAGESFALVSVISITAVLLMANYGYLDLNPDAPNDRTFLVAGDDSEVIEKQIHDIINQERSQYGVKSLEWDEKLASIARAHSQDMADRGYYSHDSPEGKSFSDRYKEGKFNCEIAISETTTETTDGTTTTTTYSVGAENINFLEGIHGEGIIASEAVDGWMDSEGHKENILTKYYKNEGIGVAVSGNKVYITQDFC